MNLESLRNKLSGCARLLSRSLVNFTAMYTEACTLRHQRVKHKPRLSDGIMVNFKREFTPMKTPATRIFNDKNSLR